MTSTQFRKFSRKNGWSCPPHILQCLAWILIIYLGVIFLTSAVPAFIQGQIALYVLSALLFGSLICSIIVATSINPADPNVIAKGSKKGILPMPKFDRNKHKHVIENFYCNLCQVPIWNSKSKHCSICNKCVSNFDHHCRWLNNCVGDRNFKAFFVTLVTSILSLIFITVVLMILFITYFTDIRHGNILLPYHNYYKNGSNELQFLSSQNLEGTGLFQVLYVPCSDLAWLLVLAVTLVLSLATVIMIIHLTVFQLYLIKRGISTYDYVMEQRKKEEMVDQSESYSTVRNSHNDYGNNHNATNNEKPTDPPNNSKCNPTKIGSMCLHCSDDIFVKNSISPASHGDSFSFYRGTSSTLENHNVLNDDNSRTNLQSKTNSNSKHCPAFPCDNKTVEGIPPTMISNQNADPANVLSPSTVIPSVAVITKNPSMTFQVKSERISMKSPYKTEDEWSNNKNLKFENNKIADSQHEEETAVHYRMDELVEETRKPGRHSRRDPDRKVLTPRSLPTLVPLSRMNESQKAKKSKYRSDSKNSSFEANETPLPPICKARLEESDKIVESYRIDRNESFPSDETKVTSSIPTKYDEESHHWRKTTLADNFEENSSNLTPILTVHDQRSPSNSIFIPPLNLPISPKTKSTRQKTKHKSSFKKNSSAPPTIPNFLKHKKTDNKLRNKK